MIIYEKENITEKDGETERSLAVVDKEADADFIHDCGHDKNPPQPCKRTKIIK